MSKIHPVSWKEMETFLFEHGCYYKGTEGSHLTYGRLGLRRPITVVKKREVPVYQIMDALRALRVEPEDFLEFFGEET